ncbi:sugar ABC transporter substrate-binding protein [Exiguobacterium sp. RIT341]|uniref:sugar ABC transporter substrate-binding protein n=1 Tax=Exiguobacterium sp. RIT341 TaxID=1470592 RepID=UPI000451802A|nr:sugar ABC transporter substrate-binding protein [Exiguobacterium sp. RIT341]EZP59127.1 ABC transporter substrate-binding protein [Exiguobacterium sp. RIT341]
MKKLAYAVLAPALLLAACANGEATTKVVKDVPKGVQSDVKIAVIRNLASDDHTKQFLDGARSEGEALGFKVSTFISEGNDVKFKELVAQAIQQDYDGLIISHGKEDYAYDMIKPAVDKGLKVVTFDTVTKKKGASLQDVTETFQNDHQLAKLSLDEVTKVTDKKPVRVIKLWFGPGFAPLDRRQEIYKTYEADGKIKTLETVGPTNFQDVQGDIATKMNAILAKYPKGSVDAVWGAWDEVAKGAYKSLKDNKRQEIPLISIDVSNQDINLMREKGSNWVSTSAVDPFLIGQTDMRLLAKKIAGEKTPDSFDLDAKLVEQKALRQDTTMYNLDTIIKGWSTSDKFNEPWMDRLRDVHKKQ